MTDTSIQIRVSAMVKDKHFKDAIKAKIGTAVDTSEMEKRIEALRTQLKQVQGTKTRLEHQMDNLDVLDTHYKKKISDLQRRPCIFLHVHLKKLLLFIKLWELNSQIVR